MATEIFDPPDAPEYVVPVRNRYPHRRQVPIKPVGQKVIYTSMLPEREISLRWTVPEPGRDYIESFFHDVRHDQFKWRPPAKTVSPTSRTPVLDSVVVAGAPAGSRTYDVGFQWYDPTLGEETLVSKIAQIVVAGGSLLTVTVPTPPAAAPAFRVLAAENPSAPRAQAHQTNGRTWQEPIGGITTSGSFAPTVSNLRPLATWSLVGDLNIQMIRFERFRISARFLEEWYDA